jgi:hypothetical protein
MADGTVREAVKDCDCLTHDGPHWIHMDNYWRGRNEELLALRDGLAVRGFIAEDMARLEAKANMMKYLGIEKIIHE